MRVRREDNDQVARDHRDILTLRQDGLRYGEIAELSGNREKAGEFCRRALQARPSVWDRRAIEKNLARLEGVK